MSDVDKAAGSGPRAAVPPSAQAVSGVGSHRVISVIVAIGAVMASLDLTIVNVAFPGMASDFPGDSLPELSWTLSAYAILYAAALVPAGRLADLSGRRRVFMGGLATFTAASALCAAAPDLGVLIAARALQAVGAAAMIPTSLSLMVVARPAEQRARAVRLWTAAGALPGAFGPFVGGLLADSGWRWIFVVNVPVGLATLAAARRRLPREQQPPTGRSPDLVGSLLLVGGIGCLTLAIVQTDAWGWGSAKTLTSTGAGAVLLVLLFARSARYPGSIVPLRLLRIRSFAVANVTVLLYGVAFAAAVLSVSLWCQDVWHWSPLVTGLALTPGNVLLIVVSSTGGPVTRRLGAHSVTALGCALLALGGVWWASATDVSVDYVAVLLPGLLVTRLGIGLAMPALVGLATADLPSADLASGSAVNAMVRQVGTAFGFSAVVSVIGAPTGPAGVLRGFHAAWFFTAATATVAGLAAMALFLTDRHGKGM